nr:VWA domain-containing protein [Candidatus Sigynarchaeota archaeon]
MEKKPDLTEMEKRKKTEEKQPSRAISLFKPVLDAEEGPGAGPAPPEGAGGGSFSPYKATRGAETPVQAPACKIPPPAPGTRRTFLPNQVDSLQNLVIDENGQVVFGVSPDGIPLDPFGKPFLDVKYEDIVTDPLQLASSGGGVSNGSGNKVDVLVPGQVDEFGIRIVDDNHFPVFGMDSSGCYALNSAGTPCMNTKWMEIEMTSKPASGKFNAILVIDISRSMMGRDLEVRNIAARIKAIRKSMKSTQIQQFLDQFKDGTYVPRRFGAALGAITFISEKINRGLGEKIAVIRFADIAETLDFDGSAFMESIGSAQEFLEHTAINIIENIGNSYGQATNMGKAMFLASELSNLIQQMEGGPSQSTPITCILLTDGYPTDGESFTDITQGLASDPKVTVHIFGLGAPNVELMTRTATACKGSFYMAETADEILTWYAERAYYG